MIDQQSSLVRDIQLWENIMSAEENKAIVLKFYEIFDRQDIIQGRDLMSPNIITRGLDAQLQTGIDAVMQYGKMIFSAFPDGCHVFEEVIAEGEKVVTRGTFCGTHRGELMGIPPTGKQVSFSVFHIDRVVDGKIVEHWGQGDIFAMMQQLGVMPSSLLILAKGKLEVVNSKHRITNPRTPPNQVPWLNPRVYWRWMNGGIGLHQFVDQANIGRWFMGIKRDPSEYVQSQQLLFLLAWHLSFGQWSVLTA